VKVDAVLELSRSSVNDAIVNWHLRTEPLVVFRKPAVVTEAGTNYIFDDKHEALEHLLGKTIDFGITHLTLEVRT